jgi:hypothetical protein
MSTYFFHEDGQGRIVDEMGCDAMDWEEEATPFHLSTLTSCILLKKRTYN